MKQSPIWRRIRKIAEVSWHACPIKIVDGDAKPHIAGKIGYYITKTGKQVAFPFLHKREDYKYIESTVRIEVGRKWIKQNATEEEFRLMCIERLKGKPNYEFTIATTGRSSCC